MLQIGPDRRTFQRAIGHYVLERDIIITIPDSGINNLVMWRGPWLQREGRRRGGDGKLITDGGL